MHDLANHLATLETLLERPGAHTRGVLARNASGEKVAALDSDATCWCLLGGIVKVTGKWNMHETLCANMIHALFEAMPDYAVIMTDGNEIDEEATVFEFNDSQTTERCMALIRRAREQVTHGTTAQP